MTDFINHPLFHFPSDLTISEQNELERDLSSIDFSLLENQRSLLKTPELPFAERIEAFSEFDFSGNQEDFCFGKELIEHGHLGCLVLAGGQGTRLKAEGPKGCFPISVIKNKSLFQLLLEKVKAASQQANRRLMLAIMTSPENDTETRSYFENHQFFGFDPSQIDFFVQDTLPLLTKEGSLFLETRSKIARGPDGNGHSLLTFVRSGIWEKWNKLGIQFLHFIPIDNPLADPFDPELLGFHVRGKNEISLKCTLKLHEEEKVGVLVKQNNRFRVLEYSEMPNNEKWARDSNNQLKHSCANLSLFCFSMAFIQQIFDQHCYLRLHKAWKRAKMLNEEGGSTYSEKPAAWKFETFIFDWLNHAKKVGALLYPRKECFAPLKNFSGLDSSETVRKALFEKDCQVIQSITGLTPPDFSFELSAEFHYPSPALREKWKNKPIISSYVEP